MDKESIGKPIQIYFLADGTASMGRFLISLNATLFQVISLCELLMGEKVRIHLVVYRDYCDKEIITKYVDQSADKLKDFVSALKPEGGGDTPEAVKTGLNTILELVQNVHCSKGRAFVVHYTDAFPHFKINDTLPQSRTIVPESKNYKAEVDALKNSVGGSDWVEITRKFKEFNVPVYTIMPCKLDSNFYTFFSFLGQLFLTDGFSTEEITMTTMTLILSIMGNPPDDLRLKAMEYEVPLTLDLLKSFRNENETDGYLPTKNINQRKKLMEKDVAMAMREDMKQDLSLLKEKFNTTKEFEDLVFRIMDVLLNDSGVLALTYNPVLGRLWRLINSRKEDPRLPLLQHKMSNAVEKLPAEYKKRLQAWLLESYNQTEEINAIIQAVPEHFPCYILDATSAEDLPTREDMISLAQAPSKAVFKAVQKLLTKILVVNSGELPINKAKNDAKMYLPVGLKDNDFFACLSHLIHPGIRFSFTASVIMAMLAFQSGNKILSPRAKSFLNSVKGRWIDFSKPQLLNPIFTYDAINLWHNNQEFMTDYENLVFSKCVAIIRIKRALAMPFTVKIPLTPNVNDKYPDIKSKCKCCGLVRSLTLILGGVCGLCLYWKEPRTTQKEPSDCTVEQSHLVQCITCLVIYAVIEIQDLNVRPKCHYCRNNITPAPTSSECLTCTNKFLIADATEKEQKNYKCEICRISPSKSFETADVLLSDLIKDNPIILSVLRVNKDVLDMSVKNVSMFKLFTEYNAAFMKETDVAPENHDKIELWHGKKKIFEVIELMREIVKTVNTPNITRTCNLCFEEFPPDMIFSPCGRCKNDICQECAREWYSQLKPGHVLLPSNLFCPFCKQYPHAKLWLRFNREVIMLIPTKLRLQPDWYYGWCTECYRAREMMHRECGAGGVPAITDFKCEECTVALEQRLAAMNIKNPKPRERYMECPKCEVMVMKEYGCDHITCVCGAHWCFRCGLEFPVDEIYHHMSEEHNGEEYELYYEN